MGLFEELARIDVVAPLAQAIHQGDLVLGEDQRIHLGNTIAASDPDLSWLFGKMAEDRKCFTWHWIYLGLFNIIPRECFGCWKIVARPRNFKELMKIYDFQQERQVVGKCGIEQRPFCTYKGWYASFWYCPLGQGLSKSREYYKEVKKDLHKYVAHDLPVILKRGCTEMEEEFGPSNNWFYKPQWGKAQDILDEFLDIVPGLKFQPPEFHTHIKRIWMRYAFEHGDPTVAEYCDNYPVCFGVQSTVTYHDTDPKILDERGVYGDSESKIERL